MKKLKNQKGITLVALVVTIIVLLILAGVSLSLVAGSDGILGKASSAVDKHQVASIKEKIEMLTAENIEKFYEAKYVKGTQKRTDTAISFLIDVDPDSEEKAHGATEEGNFKYEIEYNASANADGSYGFIVKYINKKDNKEILKGNASADKKTVEYLLTGTISESGSITWADSKDS